MRTGELPIFAIGALLLVGCSSNAPKNEAAREETAPKVVTGPATYRVRLDTSKGPVVVEVHRDWAPIGAARFEELVKDGFYDGARFFRVVPNFVVQFGLAAKPAMTKKWDKAVDDDPVTQTNRAGSLAFATMGKHTRTTQVFVNLRSNQSLDARGFAPFAQIVEGMEIVEKLYGGYGEAPDQGALTKRGNAYLMAAFPKLDYIRKASVE